MTQQWGTPGQQPGPSGQWPPQQNWNRPAQTWGTPQYGPPGQYPPAGAPQPQYPQQYRPPQAQFGQPSYGPPGGRGPQRRSPLRGVVLGLVLVVGIAFFAISLMHYLGSTDVAGPGGVQTTSPAPQNTEPVPDPDTNPPEIPQPQTYSEAEQWLTANPVYDQSAPVPTDCAVPRIDITSASVGELTSHLNDLTACLWRVWSGPLEASGYQLPRPPVTVYTEPITTGCGKLDEVNAVYCAADQRIYYARPLWQVFPKDQQKLPFVVEAVIAHEFGHTIQARTGIMISSMAFEQKGTEAEGKIFSRRLEVQADCFAGMFTEAAGPSSGLSQANLANLREVFYNLGDDVLTGQNNIQGDHGLGKSRKAWFTQGQTNTLIGTCNTYSAPASSVR